MLDLIYFKIFLFTLLFKFSKPQLVKFSDCPFQNYDCSPLSLQVQFPKLRLPIFNLYEVGPE